MRTQIINIYKFDELSDEAKEKAREWFRQASSSDEWWESTYDDAENVGFKITEFDIDRKSNIRLQFIKNEVEVANAILKNHGESCGTYGVAKSFLDAFCLVDGSDKDGAEETEDQLREEFVKDLGEEYLSILRKEYEYQQADEQIDESIRANDYEFSESGARV